MNLHQANSLLEKSLGGRIRIDPCDYEALSWEAVWLSCDKYCLLRSDPCSSEKKALKNLLKLMAKRARRICTAKTLAKLEDVSGGLVTIETEGDGFIAYFCTSDRVTLTEGFEGTSSSEAYNNLLKHLQKKAKIFFKGYKKKC